jgi:glycerol uptake facilitator-like aquaporin
VEALITFLLVFVIMAVATDSRVPAAVAAPSIGFALVAAVLIGGGAVNPDRALGPAIMSGTFTSLWLYLLAPIVGGAAAALLYSNVVAKAAPTMDDSDPRTGKKAGDRTLAIGNDPR